MLFYIWNFLAASGLEDVVDKGSKGKSVIELSDILIISLMMVVIFIVMRSTRRRTGPRGGAEKKSAKEMVKNKLAENPHVTINRLQELMAALADMSREINGQIDTRTAKLEILLAKTDRQIAEYERMLEKLQAKEALAALAANKPAPIEINSDKPAYEKPESNEKAPLYNNENMDNPAVEEMPEIEPSNAMSEKEQTKPVKPVEQSAGNSTTDQILKLAKDGISLADIARATDRPSGEVELILNLNGIKIK